MRRWIRPLLFTLKSSQWVKASWGDFMELRWEVAWSDGAQHHPLGECRRLSVRGPNSGTWHRWEAWPSNAAEPLKPPHSTLLGAGRELARRAGKEI